VTRESIRVRGAVALSLLALVAWAGSARLGNHAAASTSPWVVIALLAPLIALVILLALGGTLALTYASIGSPVRRVLLAVVLTALLAAPFIAIAVNSWRPGHGIAGCRRSDPGHCKHGKDSGGARAGGPPRTSFVTGPGLFVAAGSLVGLVLLVGGAVLLVRWRRAGPVGEESAEEALAAAAVESLDDLRAEGDVRRAIIACYARMERALTAVGASRRPAEAPVEYLRRVLMSFAPAPGRRLTELFERAAFSIEPMGVPERERAIAALEALRAATR
jgi:Domain of unknown function (DUF4129)